MSLPKINPTKTKAWKALEKHFEETQQLHMRDLFAKDSKRFDKFSVRLPDFLFDYSKNRITDKTKALLVQLCEEVGLKAAIHSQFFAEKINETENRAVLHTALRNRSNIPINFNGKDVMPEVNEVLDQIEQFTEKLHKGKLRGFTGKPITDIINLGVGGSDLGVYMTVEALKPYQDNVRVQFVSNIDGTQLVERLKKVDQETTLFVVVSKTFTTQETMTNANSAKDWFLEKASRNDVFRHFVAVTASIEKAEEFGIIKENVFQFWNWVGGRFSLWSAVGLSISCAIGYKNFCDLLSGAHEMDQHFYETDFSDNIPVLMGVLGVWYNNFYDSSSYAVLPYDQYMYRLTGYLQQADMESNGKNIDRNGEAVTYQTGQVLFGEPGTNSQHAFFQLIHQGTKLIPTDFIASIDTHNNIGNHHKKLLANYLAQTEALMKGKTKVEVISELKAKGKSAAEIEKLLPYKVFEGNKPSNTFLLKKLTPKTLGMLIASYEHKIFVQGVIWNIYSYDQWGVELGKQLANTIFKEINGASSNVSHHDSSTSSLLNIINSGKI